MPHVLDAVDRKIIHILQRDGRASNVEIARQVGVSEATVRKRLDRLLAEDTIRITAVPDAAKLGFSTITFMTISADLARVGEVASRIARLPEVRSIYMTAGENNLIVETWCESSDDLLRSMMQHIGPIPGIRKTTTAHVLRTIKDGSEWTLPNGSPVLNAETAE